MHVLVKRMLIKFNAVIIDKVLLDVHGLKK